MARFGTVKPTVAPRGDGELDEVRVTPLELFFDLVFVLALTQVTALMAKDTSWSQIGKGLLILVLLWWAYFDVVAPVARGKLAAATGVAQNKLARDSYSVLHIPMIAGIVLMALGLKSVLAHPDDHLHVETAAALYGGIALYLLGHIAMRLRNVRSVNKQRLAASIVLIALVPVATQVESPLALAMATAVVVALVAYEAIRFASRRAEIRAMA